LALGGRNIKINKSDLISVMIIILYILLLVLSRIILPKVIDLIPSKEMQSTITKIMLMLLFIVFIFETYGDIIKKQFTTTVYIVLADIVQISALAVLVYLNFKGYDATNIEVLLKRNNYHIMAMLFLSGAVLLRGFLKSEEFKKKN
jgi:hypothetical protein